MAKTLFVRVAVAIALVAPTVGSAAASSRQESTTLAANTWSLSFDAAGLESALVRRVGRPVQNSPATLRHVAKSNRVLEAWAELAKISHANGGVTVEMTNGTWWRSVYTDKTGQNMSPQSKFRKFWLTLNATGDIVELRFID